MIYDLSTPFAHFPADGPIRPGALRRAATGGLLPRAAAPWRAVPAPAAGGSAAPAETERCAAGRSTAPAGAKRCAAGGSAAPAGTKRCATGELTPGGDPMAGRPGAGGGRKRRAGRGEALRGGRERRAGGDGALRGGRERRTGKNGRLRGGGGGKRRAGRDEALRRGRERRTGKNGRLRGGRKRRASRGEALRDGRIDTGWQERRVMRRAEAPHRRGRSVARRVG